MIRYNSITHMVGYLQSRGRARQQKSTYVVMIEEEDTESLERYTKMRHAEPELRTVYEKMNVGRDGRFEDEEEKMGGEEDVEEMDDERDVEERESYTIPSTGASLHYSSAINILGHLCSLIPRDPYTPSLQPIYSISTSDNTNSSSNNNNKNLYTATITLPHVLPLPP